MSGKSLHNKGGTYRISELVAASGASRDMIKYYLRAGLLPPAQKPRPNLSLYTDNHLALIELIRMFQEQTKLSLQDIAEVFAAAQFDATTIEIELLSAKHSLAGDDNIIPLKDGPRPARGLNVPKDFLQELEDASLLDRTDPEDNEEQRAGILWAAHSAGVPLSFFRAAQAKLAELADLEVRMLIGIKRPDLNFGEYVDNVSDVDRIINRWMIGEKNRQIRQQFQRVIDNSERALSTLLDTVYQPSQLFRQRHNIDGILSLLAVDTASDTLQQTHDRCLACVLLGAYPLAVDIAEAALLRHPGDAVTTAYLTLAHGLQNNVDEAFHYGSQLETSELYHPAILEAHILALLLKAGKLGGVTDTTELMKSAAERFLELPETLSADHPEEVLLLARANAAFPDFANSSSQAIAALELLLEKLDGDQLQLPALPIPGLRDSVYMVYHTYALYYLGVLHSQSGDRDRAIACFEQVVQLDPASNFGEQAYLELGRL